MLLFKQVKILVYITSLILFISSCSMLGEDLTIAKNLQHEKRYQEAIDLLSTYHSRASKQLNAQVHYEYAMQALRTISIDKKARYQQAKILMEKSLELDPSNQRSKTQYLALSKAIKQLEAS